MSRTALIINTYSARNAGDAAIMLATASLLNDQGFDRVKIASRYHNEDRAFYNANGLEMSPEIVSFPIGMNRLDQAKHFLGSTATWAFKLAFESLRGGKSTKQSLEADAIIVAGGGYMYSAQRRFNLSLVHAMTQIVVGSIVVGRSNTYMMPQSIGPLTKRFDRFLGRVALRRVGKVVVRERISEDECKALLGTSTPLVVCPDVAFWGWTSVSSQFNSAIGEFDVTIVVMDWTWATKSSDLAMQTYCSKLSTLVAKLASSGYRLALAGHSRIAEQAQDDLDVARDIFARLPEDTRRTVRVLDFGDRSVEELRAQFSASRVVLGTRLHSCILSLEGGVPAVTLGYQPKAEGTYQLLGLDDWYFNVETFEVDDVIDRVTEVLEDAEVSKARVRRAVDGARHLIRLTYESAFS